MNFNFETERLHIQPMTPMDAKSVFNYRSDANSNRFQGWIPDSLEDVSNFISQKISAELNIPGTWFQFVILLKSEDIIIGDIGMHFNSTMNTEVEIGCTLAREYQGKGYATEALTKIIDYLFFDLHKTHITASIDPRNKSSIKLFERLGFKIEALYVKRFQIRNEWVDDLVYRLSSEEWKPNMSKKPIKVS